MKFISTKSRQEAPVRRWIAALLVAFFVVSGFLHSVAHVDASATGTAVASVQVVVAGDTADDDGQPASADVVHCHGCAASSVPVIRQFKPVSILVGTLLSHPSGVLTPSQRQFDTPPPKALV